jgi:hypothetical protein
MTLRLNLASGTDIRDGWINLDIVPKWPLAKRGCEILWDARTQPIPYGDETVDEIYAGYLLLHLAPQYHPGVLKEIRRVIKPNTFVVFGEVDMDVVMRRYLENPYNHSCSQLIWGEQGELHGDELMDFDKHCQGFTEATLRSTLEGAGFSVVERFKVHSEDVWYELTLRAIKS